MKPAGRVKQNKVGNPGRYSFALHNCGFLCVPCPAVRNREKKAAYFRVLQPEPSNAVLLYLALYMSNFIRVLYQILCFLHAIALRLFITFCNLQRSLLLVVSCSRYMQLQQCLFLLCPINFYSFSYKWQAGLVTFIRFNPLPVLRLF